MLLAGTHIGDEDIKRIFAAAPDWKQFLQSRKGQKTSKILYTSFDNHPERNILNNAEVEIKSSRKARCAGMHCREDVMPGELSVKVFNVLTIPYGESIVIKRKVIYFHTKRSCLEQCKRWHLVNWPLRVYCTDDICEENRKEAETAFSGITLVM